MESIKQLQKHMKMVEDFFSSELSKCSVKHTTRDSRLTLIPKSNWYVLYRHELPDCYFKEEADAALYAEHLAAVHVLMAEYGYRENIARALMAHTRNVWHTYTILSCLREVIKDSPESKTEREASAALFARHVRYREENYYNGYMADSV